MMSGIPLSGMTATATLIRDVPREVLQRQHTLAMFGFGLLVLAAATIWPLMLDLRLVNGEAVWLKPFKFFVSLGLFSLTTAWFFGYLEPEYRTHWSVRLVVLIIVSMSTFEIAYIVLQSLRGLPSHFFTVDPFHRVMYRLMGLGALILTGSQLVMAVALMRFGRSDLPRAFLAAVIVGLVLTWALGTLTGGVMGVLQQRYAGGVQPVATLPLLGWSLTGGDWRPAHFFALHAQQAFLLVGILLTGTAPNIARIRLFGFTAAYISLTLGMLLLAARGLPFPIR